MRRTLSGIRGRVEVSAPSHCPVVLWGLLLAPSLPQSAAASQTLSPLLVPQPAGEFELLSVDMMPVLIAEHARKHQLLLAQRMILRRRA